MALTFEWDTNKARQNVSKHGVAFEAAATVFGDPLSLTIEDPLNATLEERLITMGQSSAGRILVVVHTAQGSNIRIISARTATRRERRVYEEIEENGP